MSINKVDLLKITNNSEFLKELNNHADEAFDNAVSKRVNRQVRTKGAGIVGVAALGSSILINHAGEVADVMQTIASQASDNTLAVGAGAIVTTMALSFVEKAYKRSVGLAPSPESEVLRGMGYELASLDKLGFKRKLRLDLVTAVERNDADTLNNMLKLLPEDRRDSYLEKYEIKPNTVFNNSDINDIANNKDAIVDFLTELHVSVQKNDLVESFSVGGNANKLLDSLPMGKQVKSFVSIAFDYIGGEVRKSDELSTFDKDVHGFSRTFQRDFVKLAQQMGVVDSDGYIKHRDEAKESIKGFVDSSLNPRDGGKRDAIIGIMNHAVSEIENADNNKSFLTKFELDDFFDSSTRKQIDDLKKVSKHHQTEKIKMKMT